MIIYEPTLEENAFRGSRVISDLEDFKFNCDIIIANRMDAFRRCLFKMLHQRYFCSKTNVVDKFIKCK